MEYCVFLLTTNIRSLLLLYERSAVYIITDFPEYSVMPFPPLPINTSFQYSINTLASLLTTAGLYNYQINTSLALFTQRKHRNLNSNWQRPGEVNTRPQYQLIKVYKIIQGRFHLPVWPLSTKPGPYELAQFKSQ